MHKCAHVGSGGGGGWVDVGVCVCTCVEGRVKKKSILKMREKEGMGRKGGKKQTCAFDKLN